MHEFGITKNIVATVERYLERDDVLRVELINLRFGALQAIVPEAVEFAFETLKQEIPELADTRLNITTVPIQLKCENCGQVFRAEDFILYCTDCGSSETTIIEGKELEISNMEVIKNDDNGT